MTIEKEKDLERLLVKETKARGGICLKLLASFFAGIPDRLLLLPGGRVIFVEVKSTGEKPRRQQTLVHNKLRKLGFTVLVVDSSAKIIALFND